MTYVSQTLLTYKVLLPLKVSFLEELQGGSRMPLFACVQQHGQNDIEASSSLGNVRLLSPLPSAPVWIFEGSHF